MPSPLPTQKLTLIIVCLNLLIAPLALALPMSEKQDCADGAENCQPTSATPKSAVDEIAKGSEDDKLPRDVLELLGARFINVDLIKLIDQKTAAMLNTAVYPMKKGKNLIESYVEKTYSNNSGGGDNNNWAADSFSAGYKFGSAKNRSWASVATYTPDRDTREKKYPGKEFEEEEELDQSWIAKSASMTEYALVFVLCLIFWAWFRQSRSY